MMEPPRYNKIANKSDIPVPETEEHCRISDLLNAYASFISESDSYLAIFD